jgi:Flp pilus assembly pilin Flp
VRRIRQAGQGLAEYALLLGLIAIAAVAVLFFLGDNTSNVLSSVGDAL